MAGISANAVEISGSGSSMRSGGQSGEAEVELPSSDREEAGTRPSDLYGKYTWKIENFSEISQREIQSNVIEVGGHRWYILLYPQGCDVSNHLSIFLCVFDHGKLPTDWSHFAQLTICVVSKDPKKSKYSDALHRFCKKEHGWGWKAFMELSRVANDFIVDDILVIKVQIQVIRENFHRPFRCLDCKYRRELVYVYLTNVEDICRCFVEATREKLGKLIEDTNKWSRFRVFWSAIEKNVRQYLSREKTDVILKAIVINFFNKKEVISTLVMEALYSGYKSLNYQSSDMKEKANIIEADSTSFHVVWVEKDTFVLADNVLTLLERATEPLLPFKEDEGPQDGKKDSSGVDFATDSIEWDEWRLTVLGKKMIEVFVLAYLFSEDRCME